MNKIQSIEPLIADKFNNELRSYNLKALNIKTHFAIALCSADE